jgi:hypothetical protein
MIVLVCLDYGEVGEEKRMLESEKYWNTASVYEDNITQCTVSCWITGEQGDRVRIMGGSLIWLNHNMCMSEIAMQNLPEWSV